MKKIFALSILFLLLTSVAFAGTVNLPRTGQTKCYNESETPIPCAGTGQDGEIQAGVAWPDSRFTLNTDTTITDNLTGLVWAPDGNVMKTRDSGWDTDGTANDGRVTWEHALDYVAKLNAENYLSHNDWRLPNVNELESLVYAGIEYPTESDTVASWLNSMGFTNVQVGYYLSSTSLADTPAGFFWLVDMANGFVSHGSKGYSDGFYVWPVRAGDSNSNPARVWKTGQTISYYANDDGELKKGVDWPSPRFTDHGNETVTDNLTGLMWVKNANLPGDTKTWQEALDYVAGMNAGIGTFGYTDWRLPNRKELHSLTDFSRYNPALPLGHPFTNVQASLYSRYWSSTTNGQSYYKYWAWNAAMYYGHVEYDGKSNNTYYEYVWPVRGGQVEPTGCSTWADVIAKYQAYVSNQASWNDVITCYNQYASP